MNIIDGIEITDERSIQKLSESILTVRRLWLKAIINIDIDKVESNIGDVFRKTYTVGFEWAILVIEKQWEFCQ